MLSSEEKFMTSGKIAGLILLCISITFGSAAFAQGTDQEREACTPDAFRLCGQFIPDGDRVETCLRNAGPRLSRACYAVFYPSRQSGQAQRRQAPPPPPPAYDDED